MLLELRELDPIFSNIYYRYNDIYADFILSIKERFLLVYVLVIIFFLIFKLKDKKNIGIRDIFKDKIVILSLSYSMFVILSCVFNYNKYFTFFGSYSEGEGLLILIAYQFLFIYFYLNKNKCYDKLKLGIKILIILFSIFSILEKCGINLTNIELFKNIITLGSISNNVDIIEFNNNLKLNFGNSGYLGWFLTLIYPCLLFDLKDKNNIKSIFNFILLMLNTWMIIETGVSSCFYVVLINILIYIIYKFNIKKLIVLFSVLIISLFNFNKVYGVLINNRYYTDKFIIDEINIYNNKITFSSGDYNIYGVIEEDIILYDNELKELDYEFIGNQKVYSINGKTIKLINIDDYYAIDFGYKNNIEFVYDDRIYILKDNVILENDKFTYNKKLDSIYKLFTGRGYIWINSRDIILRNILIGSGPGSFMYEFNNNDYLGLLNAQNSTYFYIVKPHNMYIQMICTSGILSLICILFIIIIWLKLFIKTNIDNKFIFGLSIGIINYLIIGFLNDSIILVAPYFWIFFGISLNYLKKQS